MDQVPRENRDHDSRQTDGLILDVIPIHAFLDENGSAAERMLSEFHFKLTKSEVILVRDVMSRKEFTVFGEEALLRIPAAGEPKNVSGIVIELDLETDELLALATIVDILRAKSP